MAIRGIEHMKLAEVGAALEEGACFVFYEYCISLGVVTLRRPTAIYFLPPPRAYSWVWLLVYVAFFALPVLLFYLAAIDVPHIEARFPVLLIAAAVVTGVLIAYCVVAGYSMCVDGRWPDETGLKRGLIFSLVSFLLGWWGVPWGLIYTPVTMFTNLSGGQDVTDEVWTLLQATAQ